jgi:hypothetical protein
MGKKKDRVSLDAIAKIRHESYNNLGEFYERYKSSLGVMAKTTFYKLMDGQIMSEELVKAVEDVAEILDMPNDMIVIDIMSNLADLLREMNDLPNSIEPILKLRNFYDTNKRFIEHVCRSGK